MKRMLSLILALMLGAAFAGAFAQEELSEYSQAIDLSVD